MKTVFQYLDRHQKEIIRFTQSLVREESVNGNETEVAKIVREKLKEHGIKSRLVGKRPKRKSLVARVKGSGKSSIMLNGHLDTVSLGDPKKWKYNPLSAKIVGGKLFGRGTQDMKAGISAAAYAAISLLETETELNGDIILVFNADEEGGSHSGIREVLASGVRARAALVCEPMHENKLRIGSRGIYRFKIVTKGKTGHTGSTTKQGINAVTKMAKVLLKLEKMKPRHKKHRLCPPPKITPGGVIKGGSAINIVPDRCQALVDCRLSLGQTRKTILQDIEKAIRSLKDKELSYKMQELAYSPAYVTNEKEKVVKITVNSLKKVLGIKPSFEVSGPMTDGNLIFTKGIPTVTLGTKGNNSHSENEFVYTKSIKDAAKIYASTIQEFLKKEKK